MALPSQCGKRTCQKQLQGRMVEAACIIRCHIEITTRRDQNRAHDTSTVSTSNSEHSASPQITYSSILGREMARRRAIRIHQMQKLRSERTSHPKSTNRHRNRVMIRTSETRISSPSRSKDNQKRNCCHHLQRACLLVLGNSSCHKRQII